MRPQRGEHEKKMQQQHKKTQTTSSPPPPTRIVHIALEGNIGAGKSTLLERIQTSLATSGVENVVVLAEPVAEWGDLLAQYYQDPRKFSYHFQMETLRTRYEQMLDAVRETRSSPDGRRRVLVILTERSLQSSIRIFARYLSDPCRGYIDSSQLASLWKWHDALIRGLDVGLSVVVYLKTPPSTCLARVAVRGRDAERDMDLSTLERLHDLHDAYVQEVQEEGVRVVVLDSSEVEDDALLPDRLADLLLHASVLGDE